MPQQWVHADQPGLSAGVVAVLQWWLTLQDPMLDALIERAVHTNLDVRMAAARIREARALRGVAAADHFPTVTFSSAYARNRPSENVTTTRGELRLSSTSSKVASTPHGNWICSGTRAHGRSQQESQLGPCPVPDRYGAAALPARVVVTFLGGVGVLDAVLGCRAPRHLVSPRSRSRSCRKPAQGRARHRTRKEPEDHTNAGQHLRVRSDRRARDRAPFPLFDPPIALTKNGISRSTCPVTRHIAGRFVTA
jgi:hypothetical protein